MRQRNPAHLVIGIAGLLMAGLLIFAMQLSFPRRLEFVSTLVVSLVACFFILLYLFSIVWSFRDANSRGKPGWIVALFVALFSWPIGWIAWVVFRPNRS